MCEYLTAFNHLSALKHDIVIKLNVDTKLRSWMRGCCFAAEIMVILRDFREYLIKGCIPEQTGPSGYFPSSCFRNTVVAWLSIATTWYIRSYNCRKLVAGNCIFTV